MRLAQSHSAIQVQRVVGFSGRLGKSEGGGMGKAVTRGNYKSCERVFLVQGSRGHIRRLNRLGAGTARRLCCSMGEWFTGARFVASAAVLRSLRLGSCPFDLPAVK